MVLIDEYVVIYSMPFIQSWKIMIFINWVVNIKKSSIIISFDSWTILMKNLIVLTICQRQPQMNSLHWCWLNIGGHQKGESHWHPPIWGCSRFANFGLLQHPVKVSRFATWKLSPILHRPLPKKHIKMHLYYPSAD